MARRVGSPNAEVMADTVAENVVDEVVEEVVGVGALAATPVFYLWR